MNQIKLVKMNSTKIQITFEELNQLDHDNTDIIQSVSVVDALSICESSGRPPLILYNLWVTKLLKFYDVRTLCDEYGEQIILYLKTILNQTIITKEHFDSWNTSTVQLLKWLNNIITNLRVNTFKMLIIFILDELKRLLKLLHDKQLNNLDVLQECILLVMKNYVFHKNVGNEKDFIDMTVVLHSLCEVGSLLSRHGIKITLKTWDLVAKCAVVFSTWQNNVTSSIAEKFMSIHWLDIPLDKIFAELLKLMKYIAIEASIGTNEHILKVILFYVQHLDAMLKCDNQDNYSFLGVFFDIYLLHKHSLQLKIKHTLMNSVNNGLLKLFSKIYYRPNVNTFILRHYSTKSCNLADDCPIIFDYLSLCIKNHSKKPDFLYNNTENIVNILKQWFQAFITSHDAYTASLEYYTAILIMDSTFKFHKSLCQLLLETDNYHLAFSICDILRIYYRYNVCHFGIKYSWPSIEFWLNYLRKYSPQNNLIRWHLLYNFLKHLDKSSKDFIEQQIRQQFQKQVQFQLKQHDQLNETNEDSLVHFLYPKLLDSSYTEYFFYELDKRLNDLCKLQIDKTTYYELNESLEILIYYYISNNSSIYGNNENYIINIINNVEKFMEKLFNNYSYNALEKYRLFFNNCFKLLRMANEKYKIEKCINDQIFINNEEYSVRICSSDMLKYLSIIMDTEKYHRESSVKQYEMFLRNFLIGDIRIINKLLNTFPSINNLIKASSSYCNVNDCKRLRLQSDANNIEIDCLLNDLLQQSKVLLNCKSRLQYMHNNKIRYIMNNLQDCLYKK